jgi:DNA invertase Pin-like site-specific DNA recombinase
LSATHRPTNGRRDPGQAALASPAGGSDRPALDSPQKPDSPAARSIGGLQDIVRAVKAKGAALKATEQPIDTATAAGKCFLDMLGVFAEFETNLRKERQLEGIAKAKSAGVYKGRPASIDPARVRQLKADGFGPSKIAKVLGIGRASVYRALEQTA